MTNFNSDDPRITSYVLGELDEHEAKQFEQQLADNAELRQAVDETRVLVDDLGEGLASEQLEVGGIDKVQLMNLVESNGTDAVEQMEADASRRRLRLISAVLSLAAVIALLVTINTWQPKNQMSAVSRDEKTELPGGIADGTYVLERETPNEDGRGVTVDFVDEEIQALPDASAPVVVSGVTTLESTREYRVAPTNRSTANSASSNPRGESLARQAANSRWESRWGVRRSRMDGVALDARGGLAGGSRLYYESKTRTPADGEHYVEFGIEGQGPGNAGDRFDEIVENQFLEVLKNPLSTFSIDVDTASYAKMRQFIVQTNTMPRRDAIRVEELINYFNYDYEAPAEDSEDPFAAHVEIAACPWTPAHRLVRIGLKGKEFLDEDRPASNLVFLLDVSGSMNSPNKLPLLKRAMKRLVDQLGENDRVAIVVYAGAAGLVLDSTTGDCKSSIMEALDRLSAGGSTNGGDGIRLAYQTALDNFIKGGVNRVILCTDGDFNVGTTGTDELVQLAEKNAKTGVFLSVFGFGMGNHNDAMLEQISNKGNGNYGFVDSDGEANRIFAEQLSSTLITIAKDVKIQVEFNPRVVAGYRLIGYENRMLAAQDFNDDTKDAGEIGAGHTVTALYEVIPADATTDVEIPAIDELKYQRPAELTDAAEGQEMLTLKLRYKKPDGDTSKLLTFPVTDEGKSYAESSRDFRFCAAVASFGMILRDSEFKGDANYDTVIELATEGAAEGQSYRQEFLSIVRKAKEMGN